MFINMKMDKKLWNSHAGKHYTEDKLNKLDLQVKM